MKPTDPLIEGKRVVYGANQPEYDPLPTVVDAEGVAWTRWTLSPDERRAILDGACVELLVWTFGRPMQPLYMRVEGVEEAVMSERSQA